jgi:SsrA-binding protein
MGVWDCMSDRGNRERRRIAENRRARFEYEFIDTWEAGIALVGSEVKALRAGKANLSDAYAHFEGDQLVLLNLHIQEYTQANQFNHEPRRPRRLLMHRGELDRLRRELREAGLALIPTEIYFNGPHVKVELALARGKKLHDKRDTIAERDARREMERARKR